MYVSRSSHNQGKTNKDDIKTTLYTYIFDFQSVCSQNKKETKKVILHTINSLIKPIQLHSFT